jgi:hypothetical protein
MANALIRPLLHQVQVRGLNFPNAARGLVEDATGGVVHALDDVGLGQDPGRDGPVGGRQLEEHDLGRSEHRADVGLERGADPQLPATALRDSASA